MGSLTNSWYKYLCANTNIAGWGNDREAVLTGQGLNFNRADASASRSKIAATFKRAGNGDVVCVFQVATDWYTGGNAGDFDIQRLDEARKVQSSSFAFYIWIHGQDDFSHLALLQSPYQSWDL